MGLWEVIDTYWNTFAPDKIFPPKSTFSTDQIPDLSGKIAIVTGGNTGIGKLTVKALLEHNAKVYLAARSKAKAEAALAELFQATGKEAIFLELDLSSMDSVRASAKEFLSKERELHLLFNNAGVMWCPIEWLSPDGYDLQFATNVLGHWMFTELLMPALIEGAKTSPDRHARVINTSSTAANFSTLDYDTLTDGKARQKLGTIELYYQAKFATAVVSRELAKRYADKGIVSTAVNPGNVHSDLQRHCNRLQYALFCIILYPNEYGALTQLWAGTMPETLELNGEFLIPWARRGRTRAEVYDPVVGEKLWNWLEEQAKAKYGDSWRQI